MYAKKISIRFLTITAAGFAIASSAHAQVSYSVGWQGPTVGTPDSATATPITEGDILSTATGFPMLGPLPAPSTVVSGGAGGLGLALHGACVGHPGGTPCAVEVDALSYGFDEFLYDFLETPPGKIAFSMDEFASGTLGPAFMPDLTTESPVGDSSSDVWVNVLPMPPGPHPPFGAPSGHTAFIDGDGLVSGSGFTYPGLGTIEPSFAGVIGSGDNLDAFDAAIPGIPSMGPLVFFSLDFAMPDPRTGVPNSGSATAHGFTGADVLVSGIGPGPIVYAPAPALGLNLTPFPDDLDALALAENHVVGFQPSHTPYDWLSAGTDMLLFSVREGSGVIGMPDSIFGLPIEPGDILVPPVPTFMGGVSPFPGIMIAAENLGLVTVRSVAGAAHGDDLDALDIRHGLLFDCNGNGGDDAIDIAFGISADANMNGIPDECESGSVTSYCFCSAGAPCGNVDLSAGCANASGSGALLTTSGSTSVFLDDLVLTSSGLPPGAFGLFFRGTAPMPAAPFGDGLRCVGGMLTRFPVQAASAVGTMTEGPGLAAAEGFVAGDTIYIQNWYRDGAGPCGTTFNLSNAVSVLFGP